ncbi:MAG: DUF4469 domain-containing protein, partial [Treponema sp.]|nr:DUF4469 domain-containing protein [Treponema sp.]
MAKETVWKIWLTPNRLTQDVQNDFIAEVSTAGTTLRTADIARGAAPKQSRPGRAHIRGFRHCEGEARSNPEGAVPAVDCFAALAMTEGLLLNRPRPPVRAASALAAGYITLVTDIATGKTDGAITPDEDILVTGDKIKIAPEDESGLGVFFVDEAGTEHPLTHKITENLPKKLIFRVPSLAAGSYTLK